MATTKSKAKKSAAKKPAAKTNGNAKPGVIATIIETISRPTGASMDELITILTKRFPDRKPASMAKTCSIQANANAKSKDRDEKRGLVYFGKRLGGHGR